MTPRLCTALALPLFVVAALFAAPAPAKVRDVAPAFHLPGRTGPVDSDSLHARLVVVDFWASWCVPCRKSFPFLARLDSLYGPKGLAVVAVNLDKRRSDADAFLARYRAPFRVAFDPAGETAKAWDVDGMPTTYLVGEDGHVLRSHVGWDDRSGAALEAEIARRLTP